MSKPTTRDEKIKFLKDLQSGKAAIRDILPLELWIKYKGEYKNTNTGEVLTEGQYQARYLNKIRKAAIINVMECGPPLASSEDEVQD